MVVKVRPAGVVTVPETVTVPAVPPKVNTEFVDWPSAPPKDAEVDQLADVEVQVEVAPPL